MTVPAFDTVLVDALCDTCCDLDAAARHLPRNTLRTVAEQAIEQGKVHDGEWIYRALQEQKKVLKRRRHIAKIRGYAPFTNLSSHTHGILLAQVGAEILQLMAERLRDPEEIFFRWAFRFAITVREIGLSSCQDARDLYAFVTEHPLWLANREHCTALLQELHPRRPDAGAEPTDSAASADPTAQG